MVEPKVKMGMKETFELLEGLKLIGMRAATAFGDGKVDASDLTVLTSLLMDIGKLKDAFVGLDKLDDEFKDLEPAELQELGAKLFIAAQEIWMEVKKQQI